MYGDCIKRLNLAIKEDVRAEFTMEVQDIVQLVHITAVILLIALSSFIVQKLLPSGRRTAAI